MSLLYCHCLVDCEPKSWMEVFNDIVAHGAVSFETNGLKLYGIWRSQIGLPRDSLTVIFTISTRLENQTTYFDFIRDMPKVRAVSVDFMQPTLRPKTSQKPSKQGNYAFRWFDTPKDNFDEFLELCEAAWPSFEAQYDSQVIGLWRIQQKSVNFVRTLLLTRRRDLGMWERSKIPTTSEEIETRQKLSRRYDLCDWTVVYTTTLLTAHDQPDTVRWS